LDQLDQLLVPLRWLVQQSGRRLEPPRPAAAVRPSSSGSPRVVSRRSSPAIARASAACAAHSAAERLNGQATRPVGVCTSRPAVKCKNARGIFCHSPRCRGRHARFSRSVSPCASTNSKPRPASTAGTSSGVSSSFGHSGTVR
jgi:hypothetical protein